MRRLAVISLHSSPLAPPGTGDGGGMSVYVRELSSALARAGVYCDVYTRADGQHLPAVVNVEPGLRVHHVVAGPRAPVPKEHLFPLVDEFTEAVVAAMAGAGADGFPDAIHANYWLSGIAGHSIKHRLELPLVSTFHTLARVKAEASPEETDAFEPSRRAEAEAQVIGCSDAVLASCTVEADQLVQLYGAERSRIEVVPPCVDHAFFSPGHRPQARRAIRMPENEPLLLFVGRIQPLKGGATAVHALAELAALGHDGRRRPRPHLLILGGPSGPRGQVELDHLHALAEGLGLTDRVHFLAAQPHERLSTYYRAADVCLVPSRSESFGLVALEAAACATPVVASAVGGLTTLVDDGRTGYLVETSCDDDARRGIGFAARVAQILEDPTLAQAMGRAASDRARGYTWSMAGARLRRLYSDLTARSLVECR